MKNALPLTALFLAACQQPPAIAPQAPGYSGLDNLITSGRITSQGDVCYKALEDVKDKNKTRIRLCTNKNFQGKIIINFR